LIRFRPQNTTALSKIKETKKKVNWIVCFMSKKAERKMTL